MKRAIGFVVFLALITGAISVGLVSRREPTLREQCVSGLQLCSNEALIYAKVVMERCPQTDRCELVPVKKSPFLGFVDLDPEGPDSCGPGHCGAVAHALLSGWEAGRWRIIAPRLRDFSHLTPPEPIEITLEAGESYDIELVYRDALNQWPPGPFAHNCLPENAHGDGDFDGDGLRDRIDFYPGYSSAGFVGWVLRQRFGDNRTVSKLIDAECPEVIGAIDIDGDGNDELFYDTGRGMTAALVDMLKLHRGKLKNVIHKPRDTQLYVGASNAGSSDIECFRNKRTGGLIVREKGDGAGKTTIYVLRGPRLVRAASFGGARDPRGELDCFGLQWQGY